MGSVLFSSDGYPFRVFVQTDRLSYEEGNPAEISICIQNISDENAFFNVFTTPNTTFQPIVYTQDGVEEETIIPYRLAGRRAEDIVMAMVPRVLEIAPNETFFYKVDLNDFYKLKPGKKYKIRGFFMPDARQSNVVQSDNTIYLNIIEELKNTEQPLQIVRPQWIKPSEIVSLLLKAEQERRWEDYIKYIDLEKFINSYPDFAQPFNAGSDTQKRYIVKDFVSFISKPRSDYIVDFKIEEQQIVNNGNSAYVSAHVKRNGSVKPFFYDYKFKLEKFRDYWRVTGTEATISRDR